MKILIAYATTHGQTARIARRIAERLRSKGAEVVVDDVRSLPRALDLSHFDAVMLGSYVHGDRYARRLTRFIRRHVAELKATPSAFFSVCLLQLSKNAAKREATLRVPALRLTPLGWKPDMVELVAGALTWTKYGFFGSRLMKAIWKGELGELDTTRDQIFTDWAAVDRFADAFLALVERRERREPVLA
jgi:menaquinone-dependent protoporphyrinogen oxidase